MSVGDSKKTILLVDDDKTVLEFNKYLLEEQGFIIKTASSLTEAWAFIEKHKPDAIILDVGLPDGSGFVFLDKLRSQGSRIPVLMLTGYNEEKDIVRGYQGGCDDYMTKPYTFDVLLVHLKKLLENASHVPEQIEKGALTIDVLSSRALINGVDMELSQKEYLVLLNLVRHEGEVLKVEELYEQIWQMPMASDDHSVRNVVYRLRKKLETGDNGLFITISRGEGYCFEYRRIGNQKTNELRG